ncbi:hypothetical protein MUO71_06285 [Candidatus Bathyarchaeota archaeon]|nr:hypothetical protein [Candidatus Bathyarchaeota archaeon]
MIARAAKLLALIKEKLEKQKQSKKMTENKGTDGIKTRAPKLEDEDFS